MKKTVQASLVSATRLEDLRVATKTIGHPEKLDQLDWVIRFIAEDSGDWQAAECAARGECLVALVRPIPEWWTPLKRSVPPPINPDDVKSIHRELGKTLRDLVRKTPKGIRAPFMVPFPCEGLSMSIVRMHAPSSREAAYGRGYGYTNATTAIFHAVADLLTDKTAGGRLLACPAKWTTNGKPRTCGAPFMRVRKQVYCSKDCAQRVRNERKAAKK